MLLRYTVLSGLLSSSVTALVISTTTTTPTLAPRATTSSLIATTTSGFEFITTKYITIAGQTNDHVTLAPQTIALALPTCIQTITPDKNGYVPPGTCGALYDYYPSFAAAVVFAVLFGMLTVAHIAQAAVFKKVSFTPLVSLEHGETNNVCKLRSSAGYSSWLVSGKQFPSQLGRYRPGISKIVGWNSYQISSFYLLRFVSAHSSSVHSSKFASNTL